MDEGSRILYTHNRVPMQNMSMKTKVIKVAIKVPSKQVIARAAAIIKNGGLVAFPTETVYGLGANALDEQAVKKIFAAKDRPADNPLIVHIADSADLLQLTHSVSPIAQTLMRIFWPGPLTLVFRKKSGVPDAVTAGGQTVAIRMPKHPVALALITAAGMPIAGPSANASGKPSATSAQDVHEDLNGKVDMILDAGRTRIGLESTVVDVSTAHPVLLRLGGITKKQLEESTGISFDASGDSKGIVRSPGMKHRHYAPRAQVVIVPHDAPKIMTKKEEELLLHFHRLKKRVGILTTLKKTQKRPKADVTLFAGATPVQIGRNLFRCLRLMDARGVDIILVEGIPEHELGAVIMDRLRKAAETERRRHA
jgi:L-threonylcarbamoyladenylate synthase